MMGIGSLREIISPLDYRKLNAITKLDAYPLPHIDDALEQLAFKKYFCTFDLASGYFQLPMHPDDCHKTAFITHLGLFEWLVLPMGLSNSPATFQRCMAQVFRGLEPNHCLVYLDDIIVFSRDFAETMQNLESVFKRLEKANLTLKPKKCRVFQMEVAYLGHIVSEEGIKTTPRKSVQSRIGKLLKMSVMSGHFWDWLPITGSLYLTFRPWHILWQN